MKTYSQMTTTATTALSQRLLANRSHDIEFNGYLSNHVKHAIVALDRLDAPPTRVQEYWDEYTKLTPYKLPLHAVDWDAVQPVTTLGHWTALRGTKNNWPGQVLFMDSELDRLGYKDLVQTYAPSLLAGIAGALTHGIIHLGWGIDAGSPEMTAEGLAYLNFCHLGVDENEFQAHVWNDASPFESLLRIAQQFETQTLQVEWVDRTKAAFDETFHPELVPAGFQWQLSKVLAKPHAVVKELPSWLSNKDDDDLWESLYRTTVLLYLATRDSEGHGNFLVLHAITSLWALEHVTEVIDDEAITRRGLAQYWAVLVSLLATAGFPASSALLEAREKYDGSTRVDAPDFDWSDIVQRAIAEEEEHNIKLAYVARELWKRYGHWTGFREAAQSFTLTPNIGPSATAYEA